MAEAASEPGRSSQYYCHVCNEDIAPVLPEYTCPRCSSGFIEELSTDNMVVDDPEDDMYRYGADFSTTLRQLENIGLMLPMLTRASTGADEGASGGGVRGSEGWTANRRSPVTGIFDVLSLFRRHFPVNAADFSIHGNIGDYAMGSDMDRILTQMFNQMEASGPPPLPKHLISQLPTVNIQQKHVDSSLQCMVCFEDYQLNEPVRQLPCAHLFHDGCIVPWLDMHGTCPVCRCTVSPESETDAATTADATSSSDATSADGAASSSDAAASSSDAAASSSDAAASSSDAAASSSDGAASSSGGATSSTGADSSLPPPDVSAPSLPCTRSAQPDGNI